VTRLQNIIWSVPIDVIDQDVQATIKLKPETSRIVYEVTSLKIIRVKKNCHPCPR